MATPHERDAAAVPILPPAYPVAAVLAAVGLQRAWPIPIDALAARPWHLIAGGLVLGAAVLGLGASIAFMRRSGQSEKPWTPTTAILAQGPYRLTRNPMYLNMVVACIGLAILLANPWLLLLTPLVVWALQRWAIKPEEAYLERKFGAAYLAYQQRVRRWL